VVGAELRGEEARRSTSYNPPTLPPGTSAAETSIGLGWRAARLFAAASLLVKALASNRTVAHEEDAPSIAPQPEAPDGETHAARDERAHTSP